MEEMVLFSEEQLGGGGYTLTFLNLMFLGFKRQFFCHNDEDIFSCLMHFKKFIYF